MGSDILTKYYEGILNQIRGEVDLINEVFAHQGLKGEGNETVIRNLLKKFIPRKYGVGTGIVIDRHGTPSNQCDIVIYDNYNYPEILSLSSVHIYPVDLVYATIEIKTTLDSSKGKEAIENIESVRRLDYYNEPFIELSNKVYGDKVAYEEITPNPPLRIVFGYRSKTSNYETFANWFRKVEGQETEHWPSYVFCLDQGMIEKPGGDDRECFIFPLLNNLPIQEEKVLKINNKDWYEFQGKLFPVLKIKSRLILNDQSKLLLHFVMILSELLTKKKLSPHINFRNEYFTDEMQTIVGIKKV